MENRTLRIGFGIGIILFIIATILPWMSISLMGQTYSLGVSTLFMNFGALVDAASGDTAGITGIDIQSIPTEITQIMSIVAIVLIIFLIVYAIAGILTFVTAITGRIGYITGIVVLLLGILEIGVVFGISITVDNLIDQAYVHSSGPAQQILLLLQPSINVGAGAWIVVLTGILLIITKFLSTRQDELNPNVIYGIMGVIILVSVIVAATTLIPSTSNSTSSIIVTPSGTQIDLSNKTNVVNCTSEDCISNAVSENKQVEITQTYNADDYSVDVYTRILQCTGNSCEVYYKINDVEIFAGENPLLQQLAKGKEAICTVPKEDALAKRLPEIEEIPNICTGSLVDVLTQVQ